ncbi:MAG: branched-chain amino acid ABC transporter permease [Alphaproteobacteria bacterium]|nr:branched-chain amino acid ABC transporter permease [Alphaproteobacteria bacterium]
MTGQLGYQVFFAINALILAIAVLGLNLQWGHTGVFNAGVAGFLAIGGYSLAILSGPPDAARFGGFELPFVVGLLGAMAVSALAALMVGLATIRLREDYLAIATFGIATTIQLIALNADALTGGNLGIHGIKRPLADLFDGPFTYNFFYLAVVTVLLVAIYVALETIVRSPWGRVLRAIREDEVAAVSLGKNATRFRLEALVLGSALMGLSGALYVGFIGYVSAADFQPIVTFQIWTMLIVGGSGNNRGAILGTLVVWALWTTTGRLIVELLPSRLHAQGAAVQTILIGLVLVTVLMLRPRGLIGEQPTVSRHTTA